MALANFIISSIKVDLPDFVAEKNAKGEILVKAESVRAEQEPALFYQGQHQLNH
jgi:hypothetical protein